MLRPRVTVAAAAVGALALAGLGAGTASAAPRDGARPSSGSTSTATAPVSASGLYVVRVAPNASVRSVAQRLRALGATGVYEAQALHLITVKAPAGVVHRFGSLSGVLRIDPSRTVKTQSLGFDYKTQAGSMTNVTRVTRAQELWKQGITGAGVDVALIDTGIAAVPSLADYRKVVVGPDLSISESNSADRYMDTYGHGTAMAGIIAGRETNNTVTSSGTSVSTGGANNGSAYAADTANYYGMAPDARLINLKLADQNGVVDVTQMIAAINWVVQNKTANGMNIRVLNLSYGTESPQEPSRDPLSFAAEQAWKAGIVVVAAAGNDGGTVAGLSNPAYNPWVLAVGAADTKGTDLIGDDVIPAFSAKQGGNFGNRAPDLVAPGVGIVSPGVPGSVLWDTYSAARVGNNFFRGSGTSQASAVVSGAVALLLQARGWLNPDQIKAVLEQTAKKIPNVPTSAQGFGELDVLAANTANPTMIQNNINGNGTGSIESARGGVHITIDNATLQGELDVMGNQWNSNAFTQATLNKSSWSSSTAGTGYVAAGGATFLGFPWLAGSGWSSDTTSWAGRTWSGRTWSGRTWSGAMWSGGAWSGRTWSGRTWSGSLWSGSSWSTPVSSSSWASSLWASAGWK
ncbi:MAG: S8 family serine peptidase [Kineosporiaceae bacterium]